MLLAAEKVFHRLGQRELHVEHAAVAEHHHQEAQTALGIAHRNRAMLAPVHLGAFAGCEAECQEGLGTRGPNLVHVSLDDADPTAETDLAQTLIDLRGTVRMALQPAVDLRLEGIQFAWLLDGLALRVLLECQVAAHGSAAQSQFACDLTDA